MMYDTRFRTEKILYVASRIFNQRAFTLIELIVVFAIIASLSLVGIASFVTFSRTQTITNAQLDIKSVFQEARSRSLAQVNNKCLTGQQFQGYEVLFCCPTSGGTNCPLSCIHSVNYEHYELNVRCGGFTFSVDDRKFPAQVSINTTSTTSRSYQFEPLTGLVTGAGTVSIKDTNGQTKTVTVTSTGVIQ